MKLQQITLENFGVFGCRCLEFGAAPLVLVYGANEAGKTTALNGIRQAIFGFKTRTPYLTGGVMSAQVSAITQAGERLEFRRRKGRPDVVEGKLDEHTIDDQQLRRLLGGLDLESYEQLLGFTQDELRRGQETLKSARLSEALAGGSLGGIHRLEQLRTELADSLAELYKARGSNSQINVKLTEIAAAQQELKASEVLPAAVEQWRRELQQQEQDDQQLRSKLEDLTRKRILSERLLEALPLHRSRTQLVERLAKIELPQGIDLASLQECRRLFQERAETCDRIEQEEMALKSDSASLKALNDIAPLMEFEEQIETLGHQAVDIKQVRLDLVANQARSAEASETLASLLLELKLTPEDQFWQQLSIPSSQREYIQQLATEDARVREQLVTISGQLESSRRSLAAGNSDNEVVPDNLIELAALVSELERAEAELQTRTLALEEELNSAQMDVLRRRLAGRLHAGAVLNFEWQLPDPTDLERFANRFDEVEDGQRQRRAVQARVERDLHALQAQSEGDAETGAHEFPQRMSELAERRDELLQHWLDELSQPLLAASISLDDQQARLRELQRIGQRQDQSIKELLEVADTLAAAHQRSQRIQQLRAELTEISDQEQASSVELERLNAEWKKQWEHLPVEPAEPQQMQKWSEAFRRCAEESRQVASLRKRLHLQFNAVKHIRSRLVDAWPSRLSEDAAVAAVRERVDVWGLLLRTQQAEQQRRSEMEANVESLEKQRSGLQSQRSRHIAAYRTWLTEQGLSFVSETDWPLEKSGRLLDVLEAVRREHKTHEHAERAVDVSVKRLHGFENAVDDLSNRLQSRLGDISHEDRATHWLEKLRQARVDRDKRVRLTTNVEHRQQRLAALQEQLRQTETRIQQMSQAGPAVAASELQQLVERQEQAQQLKSQLRELSAALSAYLSDKLIRQWLQEQTASASETAVTTSVTKVQEPVASHYLVDDGGASLLEFCQLLSDIDEVALRLDAEQYRQKQQDLEHARQKLHQEIGSLRERISQLADSQAAVDRRQRLQDLRGDLSELAEQWMVGRLAQELLLKSIELFSQENEPAVLQFAREYLHQLTSGRYTQIEHDPNQRDMFVVRNARGETLTPDRLSTGTREQLYLAVRMAFVRQHFCEHEPLPVLMDDCFVNFDDQRTKLALQAIAGWESDIQTVILSCHSRVPGILAEIAPETPVIDLQSGSRLPAGDFMAQLGRATISEV